MQSYLSNERIQKIEQQAMSAAFKLYDKNVKYGGEETIKKYRGMLENTIKQQLFTILRITNDAHKTNIEVILQDAVTTCLDNYRNGVLERTHEKWTGELEQIHECSYDEAMKPFIVVSTKNSCEQLVNSYNEELVKKLNQKYMRFKKDNERYKNSTEEENRIDKEFQEQCDKKLSADEKYIDEEELQQFLDSKIADLIETSLAKEKVATEKMKGMFRQAVEQRLEERAEEITSKNVDKKINYRLRLKQQLGQIKLSYIADMEEELNKAYVEPKVLDEFHKKLLKDALNEVRKDNSNLTVFMEHKNEVEKDLKSLHTVVHKWNEDNKPLRKKVIAGVSSLGIIGGGSMAGVGLLAFAEIGVFGLLSGIGIAAAGAAVGVASGIYFAVSNAKKKREKEKLMKEEAAKVSSGELGSNGGIMGSNDCVVEVPPKAIKEGEEIKLSSSFRSEQWQEGYFAITPLFQCDPGDLKFLKEISIELPTWCSTSSKEIFAHLMENNVGAECLKQKEIKLTSVSDYVIKFKTSHFNTFCCFVKSSEIDLCSFRLSLQLFLQDNHDVIVIFHLTDKTVQNVFKTVLSKSGVIPNFEKIENFVVKHGESVDMSLRSLGNAVMDDAYSMKFVVDNEFVRTGYIWKVFHLHNLEITKDVKLEYILNGKTKKNEFKFINLENNDSSNAAKLALN